jgi:hypothetical protein
MHVPSYESFGFFPMKTQDPIIIRRILVMVAIPMLRGPSFNRDKFNCPARSWPPQKPIQLNAM